MKQQTLNGQFSVKGKGLHTGLEIEAEFLPAPENHGYKFQRVDLPGEPVIDALAETSSTPPAAPPSPAATSASRLSSTPSPPSTPPVSTTP